MIGLRAPLVGLVGAALAAGAPARAAQVDERLEVYGYAQIWATIWEDMEDLKGEHQPVTGDEASTSVSGFSLAKARVGVRVSEPSWDLSLHAQARLDHDFMLLDADAAWSPARWFSLHLGQFKVPGTFEALTDDRNLRFILRTELTTALADYGLAKADHTVSLLYGSASNLRDLGLAMKGEVGGPALAGRYFLMVGNGLGAGMYFGGSSRKEYFISNRAQFYYGARLEVAVAEVATAGLFGSVNRHDDMAFNSGRSVYDLDRRVAGADLQVVVPGTGLRLDGLAGAGQIRDDFNADGNVDLKYSGWAASVGWDVFSSLRALRGWPPDGHALELCARHERIEKETDESGLTRRRDITTFGVNYVAPRHLKVQLDWILRRTEDPGAISTPGNDAVIANFQVGF